jgi:NAD dependent epimerase/dehydratase family enzyme
VVLGRDGGMIKQLYLPFFCGLGGPVMPGDQYLPWIHIDDLIRLILFVVGNQQVEGTLNGVAPQNITNKQFSDVCLSNLFEPVFIKIFRLLLVP